MSKLTTLWTYLTTPKVYTSRKAIEKIQRKGMAKHVKMVRKNSPFFSRHWAGLADEDWREFPLVNKAIMMEHLQDYITADIDVESARAMAAEAEQSRDFHPTLKGYTVGFSSGTSGARGMHFISQAEQDRWAGYMLARGLDGSIFGKHKLGLFLRANSNTYESVSSSRIKFQFYDLMRPLDELVAELVADPPDVLIAPPSILRYLADQKIPLPCRKLISVAEVLTPLDRDIIEQHFQRTVHQFYTSTEGEIAATCEHGTLHLNEEIMVIQKEWIDEDQTMFHPIISDFKRTTQPMIRYRQNDILVVRNDPCPCGDARQAISEIIGRQDDVFEFETTSGTTELVVPDMIRRATLAMHPDITAYMVEQLSPSRIKVQLEPLLSDLDRSSFEQLWEAKDIVAPEITVEAYEFKPSATKMRRITKRF